MPDLVQQELSSAIRTASEHKKRASPSASTNSPAAASISSSIRQFPSDGASRDSKYMSARIPASSRPQDAPSNSSARTTPATSPIRPTTFPPTPTPTTASIARVLDPTRNRSLSPRTPQTPRTESTPSTTSPIGQTRRPRYHHSSDTPLHLRASPAFPALPFSFDGAQQARAARVRFTPDTRSLPKLNTTPIRLVPPPVLDPPLSPSRETVDSSVASPTSDSPSSSRRRSAELSAEAARSALSVTWQRQVAEEMVRLSMRNPNASMMSGLSAGTKRSRHHSTNNSADLREALAQSSRVANTTIPPLLPFPKSNGSDALADVKPNSPRTNLSPKRHDKENNRQRKLDAIFANTANETIQVHVVKQEENLQGSEALAIEPWTLQLDIPTPNLGPSSTPQSNRSSQFVSDKKKSGSDNPSGPDNSDSADRAQRTKRKQRRARESQSSSTSAARTPRAESSPDPSTVAGPGPSTTRALVSAMHSASSPSLRGAASRRSTPVRPSTSLQELAAPGTPPRSGTVSPAARSSPGESPTPSRHRLSSYALDPRTLFFTPRAHPPEGYDAAPPSGAPSSRPTSSYVTAPQSSTTSSTPQVLTRPASLLVPGQIRLLAQEDQKREEDAISLGKGKGKRLGPDDEYELSEAEPLPVQGAAGTSSLPLPIQRQRLESNMTRTTDDDVLGDLPFNPRKRIKLSSSAALVQSLTEAAAAQSNLDTSNQSTPSSSSRLKGPNAADVELKGILHKKHQSLGPAVESASDSQTTGYDRGGPSRASSRRSHSVSFTLQNAVASGSRSVSAIESPSPPTGRRSRTLSTTRSRASIPFMAIISPRPVSLVAPGRTSSATYRLREPRRYSSHNGRNGASVRSQTISPDVAHTISATTDSQSQSGRSRRFSTATSPAAPTASPRRPLPLQGWAFFAGFLLPLFWWIASFMSVDSGDPTDVEHGGDWVRSRQDLIKWRRRCRVMAICSTLVYIPVITLAVVFGR